MHGLTGPSWTNDVSQYSGQCNFLKDKEVQGMPVEFIAVRAGEQLVTHQEATRNSMINHTLRQKKALELSTENCRLLNKHNKEADVWHGFHKECILNCVSA